MPRIVMASAVLGAALLHGWVPAARAGEIYLSFYLGAAHTRSSDLRVVQPATQTDATFRGVSWEGRSFQPSPYYGVRLTYFFSRSDTEGINLDFTHYKILARTNRIVPVEGVWRGAPQHGTARMSEYVQSFEITHGLNMLSLDATVGAQAYAGAGVSYYIVHGENRIGGQPFGEGYRGSGFGFQMLGGLASERRHGAPFAEYKHNSGEMKVETAGPGQAQTHVETDHLLLGIR